MLFNKTLLIFSIGISAVLAAPILPRDASTVENDISTVQSDVTALDSKVKSFSGSIISALSFLVAYDNLDSSVKTATTDIGSSSVFSAADSSTIATAVNTLSSSVVTTLNDLIAKESTVSSSGYSSDVLSALKTLQTDADAFFTALGGKVDPSQTSAVAADKATVDTALASAIAAY